MVWVYYHGQLDNIIVELNAIELLAEKYPDAIYFFAELVMTEV
jgi:hypothetical protein